MSKNSPVVNSSLINDPIAPTIRRMTVPMIFGMITLMSFNLVDTFFVGLLGTEPLAALSFTFAVTFTVISLAIGLGIGTSAVIAKALGAGKHDEAQADGLVALIISAVLVFGLSLIGYFNTDLIFSLLGAGENTMPLIRDYITVWFLGSVVLITPMIGNSILRASGDTKMPSIIMGGAGLINALLDPMLIFGFGPIPALGIQGAAIASVIAWSLACIFIIGLLVKRQLITTKMPSDTSFAQIASKMLRIGFPAAGANMLTPLAMAVLTAIVANYGHAAVAAFGVGSRLESIASLVVLALSMTLPPFVSQNFGANRIDRVMQAYKETLKFVLGWQLLIYIVLVVCAGWISQVFSDDQSVAEIIKLFIWILPLGYGLQGIIILTNSSFNALHRPSNALILSVIRLFIFYVPLAWLGSEMLDLTGLFFGGLLGNVFTAAIAFLWFTRYVKGIKSEPVPA